MINAKFIALATVAALSLSACANPGDPNGPGINKQGAGTVLGAGAGALLGSTIGKGSGRTVAMIAGGLLGAGLGNSVGASLDRQDMQYYNQASQHALETAPSGQALPWSNPQSGNGGTITPTNYYQGNGGQYCREYTQTIHVGGQTQQGYGTACRQPDGTWQIANQ